MKNWLLFAVAIGCLIPQMYGILCHMCYKRPCRTQFSVRAAIRDKSIIKCKDGVDKCIVMFVEGEVMRKCGNNTESWQEVATCTDDMPANTTMCSCSGHLCNGKYGIKRLNASADLTSSVNGTSFLENEEDVAWFSFYAIYYTAKLLFQFFW